MSEENFPIWIVIRSKREYGNIHHYVFIFTDETAVRDFKTELEADGFSGDIRKFNAKKGMTNFHVVFHYHDNYADVVKVFGSLESANQFYLERIDEMKDELKYGMELKDEMTGAREYPGSKVQRQSMRTMYDSDGRYPDKGSRWVITSVELPLTGGRKTKRTRYQKTARRSLKLLRKTKKRNA